MLAAVMLLSISGCDLSGGTGSLDEQSFDQFVVGFGRADITPYDSVPLAGYGSDEERYSQGYLDYLYCLTLAMTDTEGNTILLIVADLAYIEMSVATQVRQAIRSKYPLIPEDNIIVGATHNHSGPSWSTSQPETTRYMATFLKRVVASVDAALEDRKPATFSVGRTETENLNFVRRYWQEDGNLLGDNHELSASPIVEHESEADAEIQMVKIVREGEKDILITNWQAHPNRLGWEQRYMASSEWVGRMRAKIEAELNVECIYYQGAAGNMNPNSRISEENVADTWNGHGEAVAQYVIDAYNDTSVFKEINTGNIQVQHQTLTATVNKLDIEKKDRAQEILDLYEATGNQALCEEKAREYGIETIRHAWGIVGRSAVDLTRTVNLYTISMGDLSLATLPWEMFNISGLQIKEQTPFEMTLLMGYTCGEQGYMPDEEAYANGGYEYHNCLYVSGTAEQLVSMHVTMLKEMYETRN